MNDLIKITKSSINGVEVNSINARNIHEYLEVKTPFSMWIKRAIEKYDFLENEDFTINKFVNGKNTQFDYIVTLDVAKELSMLENNPKGKETRKYFISIEKQFHKVLTTSDKISLLAQGHEEIENRIVTLEHKIDNEITLTSAQKFHLKNLVSKKVYSIKEDNNFSDSFIRKGYSKVWKMLKNKYVVSTYMDIPKIHFDDCCNVVCSVCVEDLI